MPANPMGPTFDGGDEVVGVNHDGMRYELLFLPDVENDALQREGKPPVYYWVPRAVRIARKGEAGSSGGGGTIRDGDYKFRLIHFVGVQDQSTHVGVSGTRETAGGVMAVTTTCAPPLAALESAKQALIARVRGSTRRFWALRSNLTPQFAPTPVSASRVALSNLSPNSDGSVPIELPTVPGSNGGGAPSGSGAATVPPPAGGGAVTGPPGTRNTSDGTIIRASRSDLALAPTAVRMNNDLRYEREVGGSAIDPWHWGLQGNGPGPLDPASEHAFSGLLGTLPTAILWQGFKGAYSPISVVQSFLLPVWSTNIKLKITGEWDRIFEHFSTHAKGRAYWFSADIKAEFNNLMISGGIKVELLIDGTAPGADKVQEEINKRIDLITTQFTEQAKAVIFVPAPTVEPAQAPDGGGLLGSLFGWGGGLALKYRRDSTRLRLNYEETRKFRYNRLHVVSSSLEGFYDDIKRDPNAERKYFETLYLDDWDRKVSRIVKPVVNWPDPSQKWVGDPVAFLSCQVGYPDTRGAVQWAPRVFQSTDTGDTTRWTPAFAMKAKADVVNPPGSWEPDKTFVKRRVHFTEPPSALENPYNRVFVERNTIDLDPGENGTLSNDNTIEVRADSIGVLEVGPISIGVALEDRTQQVEVEFQAKGKTLDGKDRPVVRFQFKYDDQDEPRRWKIFTGDPDFLSAYRYRVRVIVKGSIFSKGVEWVGPWFEDGAGNGPLTVSIPTPEDPGVVRRAILDDDWASTPIGALAPPPTTISVAPPPGVRSDIMGEPKVNGYLVGEPQYPTSVTPPPPVARVVRDAGNAEQSANRLELLPGWRNG